MSRASPDDQLKFLLSCVRHANNGKARKPYTVKDSHTDCRQIDFVEVAKDCGVVSKGAAAKRYERLLKANGIHPHGTPSDRPVMSGSNTEDKSRLASNTKSEFAKRRRPDTSREIVTRDNKRSKLCVSTADSSPAVHLKSEGLGNFVPQTYPYTMMSQLPQYPTQQFVSSMPNYAPNFGQYPQSALPQRPPQVPRYIPAHQPVHSYSSNLGSISVQAPNLPQLSKTLPEKPVPNSLGEPFVLDEKVNALFDDFCKSDIFTSVNDQATVGKEHQVVDNSHAASTDKSILCPTLPLPPKLIVKAEPGAEPQQSILIID